MSDDGSPARWPLVLSATLYAVSMGLPTMKAAITKDAAPELGHQAFTGSFRAFADDWPFAVGSVANVAYGLALAAAPRDRAATEALALIALLAAIACSLAFFPHLQGFPGWWAWTASFALLARPRALRWLVARADRRADDVGRAAVLGLALGTPPAALLAPEARRWTSAALLVPGEVAVVLTCFGAALVGALALRLALARRPSGPDR